MNAQLDLEQVVTDWLRSKASASGSDRVLDAALGRVTTARQERRRPVWVPSRIGSVVTLAGSAAGSIAADRPSSGVRARSIALALLILSLGLILVGGAMLAGVVRVRPPAPGGLLYGRDGDIFLASRNGLDPAVIVDGAPSTDLDGTWYALESWAPDGSHFVYHEVLSHRPPVTHIADATGRSIASFEIEPATPGATPEPTRDPERTVDRQLKSKWHTWWSPDSTLVAVFPWNAEVRIFGLDGRLRASLPLPPGYGMWREFGLRWAHDSRAVFVVIASGGDGAREVWRLALDGAPPERLPPGHALERWDVEMSPDGRRVAFSGLHYAPLQGPIYVASADGSDPQPIEATRHGGRVSSFPMWSPDGTRLAYMVALGRGGLSYDFRVVDLRTGTDKLVARVREDGSINRAWYPDGQRLLVRAYDVEPATQEGSPPKATRRGTALWSIGVDGSDVDVLLEDIHHFGVAPRSNPSPTLPPSPTPSSAAYREIPPGDRQSLTVDGIPLSFSVPNREWWPGIQREALGSSLRADTLYIAKQTAGGQRAEAVVFWTTFPGGGNTGPCHNLLSQPIAADLAAAVATAPGIDLVAGPTRVTVGGLDAKHVALAVREDLGCDPGYFFTWPDECWGTCWIRTGVGDEIGVWVIDVDGRRLVIETETTRQGVGDANRGNFVEESTELSDADLQQEVQQIVDSIRFE